MKQNNNGVYVRLLITGLIMFNLALCYTAYTMYFPDKGLPFSSPVKYIIYGVYIIIMMICLLSAFSVNKRK